MAKRRLFLMALLTIMLSGCVLTKIVTVPMRAGGAVISVVPLVGNPVDHVVDSAADGIDKVPL